MHTPKTVAIKISLSFFLYREGIKKKPEDVTLPALCSLAIEGATVSNKVD